MKVVRVLCPIVAENCYIAVNEKINKSIIIDPGSGSEKIKDAVAKTGATPEAVLLTHGHFDHAGSANEIASFYGVQIYAYEGERETLENPAINLSGDMFGDTVKYHADIYLKDDEEIDIAGLRIRCLFTPGHTPGGCCFYFPDEGIVFTGDTLFCGSVGRTDFPGGSMSQLVNAVRTKLMVLPDDTICYPGHDTATTIENERIYNPYL